jgi:hypothetical protein
MAPRKPKPGRKGDDEGDDAASEAPSPKSRATVSDEDEDADPLRSKLIDVLDRLHSTRTQIR